MDIASKYSIERSIIYFMACGPFIKIGTCGPNKALQRLAQLKTGNPYPITPLGFTDSGFIPERELHKRFFKSRHEGEWFKADVDLLEFIEQYAEPWIF